MSQNNNPDWFETLLKDPTYLNLLNKLPENERKQVLAALRQVAAIFYNSLSNQSTPNK